MIEIEDTFKKWKEENINLEDTASCSFKKGVLWALNRLNKTPLRDNPFYLKGLIDGYGNPECFDDSPGGFNSINDVWDKLYD